MKKQNSWPKSKIVLQSMASFDSLRKGLAYMRSVSIVLQHDGEAYSDPDPIWVADLVKYRGAPKEEDAEEFASQLHSYYLATTALPLALLYAALCHYRALVRLNKDLRYAELDSALIEMEDCGLFEKMRHFRNAVFHIRPNKRIDQMLQDILTLSLDNNLPFVRLEQLLYDFTDHAFLNFNVLLQESEEKLKEGYKQALAHYDTLPQAIRDEHEKEIQERGKALDSYF